jgi:hypothetical protein
MHRPVDAGLRRAHGSSFKKLIRKAMTHSSRRIGRTKAIAEALAMIADAFPEPAPQSRCPARECEEWLWQTATEFCAAMDRYTRRARGGLRIVRE